MKRHLTKPVVSLLVVAALALVHEILLSVVGATDLLEATLIEGRVGTALAAALLMGVRMVLVLFAPGWLLYCAATTALAGIPGRQRR